MRSNRVLHRESAAQLSAVEEFKVASVSDSILISARKRVSTRLFVSASWVDVEAKSFMIVISKAKSSFCFVISKAKSSFVNPKTESHICQGKSKLNRSQIPSESESSETLRLVS